MEQSTKSTAKRWTLTFVSGAFAIALALLFTLVLRSIAVQIAPPPDTRNEPYPDVTTQERCTAAGGQWQTEGIVTTGPDTKPITTENRQYCQGPLAFERQQQLQAEDSQQTSLFVFAIGGGIAVVLSLLVNYLRPVAPGLMIGGIVSFFIAGIHIWTLSPGIGRLVTIVIIFAVLVGVGLYTLRDH